MSIEVIHNDIIYISILNKYDLKLAKSKIIYLEFVPQITQVNKI